MLFAEYPYINFNDLNLDWIIKLTKDMRKAVEDLDNWKITHEAEYKELKKLYDDIVSGNFPDSMIFSLRQWLTKNAFDIIGEMVKTVFFGLTYDGYFVAYIPDSWRDIIFNTTGYDINVTGVGYGHLVLSY